MRKNPELPCAIVEDLLPAYVEGLTSEETNAAVLAHLTACPACAAKRAAMGAPEEAPSGQEETAREVDYLKKVRRRSWRRVAAAILCTALVLAVGLAAKVFVIGTPLQSDAVITSSLRMEDDVLQICFSSTVSGNAFRSWTVDDQDGVVSITARSVLVSPLFSDGSGTVEVSMEGVTEIWLGETGQGRMIWQDDTEISADAWALYQAQTPYVGDASAVGKVLAAVDTWYGPYIEYTISLQTDSEPYGLTIHFDDITAHTVGGADRAIDQRMYALAPMLLALVGNLEEVQWTCAMPDGTVHTQAITLTEVDEALPGWIEARNLAQNLISPDNEPDWIAPESIKDSAVSPAKVQQLMDLTDHGFYVVTEEDGTTVFTPQF